MKRTTFSGLAKFLAFATCALIPSLAEAHFTLVAPECSRSQDALGSPQKLAPCGDESGGTETGKITTYKGGETIDIVIDEKIYHPGHYRIALAVNDRSELPAEPIVTAGSTPCGSAPIDPNPAFPVLADGLLKHTAPFSGPQTVKVTLPTNVTCTRCTLQVLEFMSNHVLNNPGGCYYHHCANIAIQGAGSDGGSVPDASTGKDAGPTTDGGAADDALESGGCSMSSATASGSAAATVLGVPSLLVVMAAFARRRRRTTER